MVGSVFSPYYYWAGRRDPLDHVAVNIAIYRRGRGGRWALTERGRQDLWRAPGSLQIGPSVLFVDGDALQAEVDERGCPFPFRVRGRLRLLPEVCGGSELVLAAEGDHRWWPIAPRARVEVAFEEPAVRWSGTGYLDCNWGAAPLEGAFHGWSWSRAPLGRGAAVLYDVQPRRGPRRALALRFDGAGTAHLLDPPPPVRLRRGLYGMVRETRSEGEASLVRTLTDTHFYARSLVQTRLCGERVVGVHESLSLDRFGTRWAKLLLPFRMPRSAR